MPKSAFLSVNVISELLQAEGGILTRHSHHSIRRQLDYCLRRGTLCRLLPGIYAAPDPSWPARVLAAASFRPDCIITGAAAARLLWWPDCPMTTISAAIGQQVKAPTAGYAWERRVIHDDLVVNRGQLRIACPAVSILDLIPTLGGQVIDEGLRRKAVDVPALHRALKLMPHRPHNKLRRQLVDDSRDEPWSEAERRAHGLLRAAGITGWVTNRRITAGAYSYTVDLVFLQERVVIEIDGWQYHKARGAFVADRWRYSRLAAADWLVLPLAATAVEDEPDEFVSLVTAALQSRR